jgi:hypothetical protein
MGKGETIPCDIMAGVADSTIFLKNFMVNTHILVPIMNAWSSLEDYVTYCDHENDIIYLLRPLTYVCFNPKSMLLFESWEMPYD